MTKAEPQTRGLVPAASLDADEHRQLARLRRWGTAGALLMMIGSTSSYGAASPIPNPVDGIRVLGLMSRLGPAALAIAYAGMGLLVLCWLLIGRLAVPGRPRRLSRTQLTHTLAMWTVPFLVTPPIFSRDVYSYLAVGSMADQGFNPYDSGPYDVLGDADVFSHQVDARWQHTPSPYGPAYLLIARAVFGVTGQHLIAAILLQRLVELVGVAAILWALPRLARMCGVDPVAALWLGTLSPLLLFHLIAGAHNEALMLGAMLAGLVVALRPSRRLGPTGAWVLGTVIITVGVAIKVTAAMALPFLVIALALRKGPGLRELLRQVAQTLAVALLTFGVLTWIAGYGFGWVAGLGAPGTVRSFLSVTTSMGVVAGRIGLLLGVGDHTDAAIAVMQPLGTAAGFGAALWLMWLTWKGRLPAVTGLGLALGAVVLLGPVIQPWYLLWAVLPLATSTDDSRFRLAAVWLTAAYSLIIMPNGGTIPPFTIVQAVGVAALVVGVALVLLRRSGLPRSAPLADGPSFLPRRPPAPSRTPGDRRHALFSGVVSTAPAAVPEAIEVAGLTRRFGDLVAVDDLSFTAVRGEVLALLGPNGAGKSSTLAVLEGFARPDAGVVRVLGMDPWNDAARLRSRLGVMLQAGGAHLSARTGEMLDLVARCSARPHDTRWLLDVLGLTAAIRTPVRRLSGGQLQRLSLAMALAGRPELLILDEPTAGMDPQARHLVWDLIRAARADGVTIVLTTHLLDEAELLADRVLIIDHGHAVAAGTPAQLVAGGDPRMTFTVSPSLSDLAMADLRSTLPTGVVLSATGPSQYLLAGSVTADVVAAVTAVCARHGAMPTDLHAGSRSLDEVYLSLTGEQVRS